MRTYVQKELANNKYEVEGGGYLYGREILPPGANTDVSSDKFETLSKKGQNEFTNDLMKSMDDATSMTDNEKVQNNVGAVNTQTSTNWLKDLQNNPGMGSKILQQTLANTKPDFVSANEIYKPFSGLIGTIIALLAILMMAFLAVTLVIDLCYITIPFARVLLRVKVTTRRSAWFPRKPSPPSKKQKKATVRAWRCSRTLRRESLVFLCWASALCCWFRVRFSRSLVLWWT